MATVLVFIGSGCTASDSLTLGSGAGVRIGSGSSVHHGTYRNWDPYPIYGHGLRHRPAVACDSFGRCWQLRSDPFERRYAHRGRPPGWADDLPRSARVHDRFLRPRSDLVCDRATRICYKDRKIDKSDTERVFGERAGDRADDLRDRFDTARLFVPQRGVACDRNRKLCLEEGDPDRKLTRRYFGRKAARALDDEEPRGNPRKDKRRGKRKKG